VAGESFQGSNGLDTKKILIANSDQVT
jgi:hypothetical protein